MKRFYAVQHGNDFSSDYGSTVHRKAVVMAHELGREFPGEEIRICWCHEGDDFCDREEVIREGTR